MDNVQFEVKVPQYASVLDMNNPNDEEEPEESDKIYFEENGLYDIETYENGQYSLNVGFNPVNVLVPNMVASKGYNIVTVDNETHYIQTNKIERNGIFSIDEYKNTLNVDNPLKKMLVGFNNFEVAIKNGLVSGSVKVNGLYELENYHDDHPSENLSDVIGFRNINIDVPNKTVVMNSEVQVVGPNQGTVTQNGIIRIEDWRNSLHINDPYYITRNEYVGFNNIKVDVKPRLVGGVEINNPGVYTIENYNSSHPGIVPYDGFSSVDVKVSSGSVSPTYPKLIDGPVLYSNNCDVESIVKTAEITPGNTILFPWTSYTANLYKVRNIKEDNDIQGFLTPACYITGNNYEQVVENNQNVIKRTPGIIIDSSVIGNFDFYINEDIFDSILNINRPIIPSVLFPIVEGQNSIPPVGFGSFRIELVDVVTNPNIHNYVNLITNNGTSLLPDVNLSVEHRDKRVRGDQPLFVIKKYKNVSDVDVKSYNNDNSTKYFAISNVKLENRIDMLEYDTFDIEKSELGTTVEYDIESDFYTTEKNPLIPNDPEDESAGGHYDYNPIGLRKLKINVPTKLLKSTNTEQTHASATVNFNNSNKGLAIITLSDVNFDGFESPVYADITGTNFPINVINNQVQITSPNGLTINDYNTINSTNYQGFVNVIPVNDTTYSTSNTAYELSSTTTQNIPIGTNCSGLSNVYVKPKNDERYSTSSTAYQLTSTSAQNIPVGSGYSGLNNVYVKPKNYDLYTSSNRYSITNFDGYISIPSGYSGLGTVYYNVDVRLKVYKCNYNYKVNGETTSRQINYFMDKSSGNMICPDKYVSIYFGYNNNTMRYEFLGYINDTGSSITLNFTYNNISLYKYVQFQVLDADKFDESGVYFYTSDNKFIASMFFRVNSSRENTYRTRMDISDSLISI